MPRYDGTFVKCPLCGEAMPEVWQGKLRPGQSRVYCGPCWYAAMGEMVTAYILKDPVGWRVRLEREAQTISGTVLDVPRPVMEDPRPPAANHDDERTQKLLEHLDRPEIRPAHGKQLDRALGWRNGTANRILLAAEAEGNVVLVKAGRRNTYTTARRWASPEFANERRERDLQKLRNM